METIYDVLEHLATLLGHAGYEQAVKIIRAERDKTLAETPKEIKK